MSEMLPELIRIAGFGQASVLVASALVPFRLKWKTQLDVLPRLHRQMYWIYGGYVVLAIISNGNTVKATEYSFLANVLAARGYLVASIQQDLPRVLPIHVRIRNTTFDGPRAVGGGWTIPVQGGAVAVAGGWTFPVTGALMTASGWTIPVTATTEIGRAHV